MQKPKCVIVDDEDNAIGALKNHLEEIGLLELEQVFNDPDRFLSQLDKLESKIAFLDMEMGIFGDEVAHEIGDRMKVIFVSGRTDTGTKAFDVEAVDFVQKPIQQYRLKKAIKKVLKELDLAIVVVRTAEATKQSIKLDDVVMIKPGEDSRDKEVLLRSRNMQKPVLIKGVGFKRVAELFPNPSLIQINKDTLINVDFVTKLISADLISIQVDDYYKELTLGDSFKVDFFRARPEFK